MSEDQRGKGKKTSSHTTSRRKFIRDEGMVVGGTAIGTGIGYPSLNATELKKDCETRPWLPDKWDMEVDVVVVGSGTGCAAATEAAEAGASVVVLEKYKSLGGTTRVSAGGIIAAGTSVQKDLGIHDSAESFYDYLMALGGIEVDPDLCKTFAAGSVELFEWCRDYLGCRFPAKLLTDHNFFHAGLSKNDPGEYLEWKTGFPDTPPRTHWVDPPTGETYIAAFRKKLAELGTNVLTKTPLKKLVYDPVNQEVLGVKAEKDGKTMYIKAEKGVVLATGGHGHNKHLVRNLELSSPTVKAGKIYRPPLFTGDGIVAGMKVGGWFWPAVESGPDSNPNLPLTPKTFYDVFETLPRIYVNKNGTRYINEHWYQAVQAAFLCEQPDRKCWCILDDKARADVGWDFSKSVEKGIIVKGDTIRTLAEKAKINSIGLESTVADWNRYVDNGKDPEWGRERRYRDAFSPLKASPFYAAPIDIYIVGGHGPGLKINTKAQVVNIDQEPIRRLYATGADCAGVMPSMYIGCGSALSIGFLFGRIAGKNVAAEKRW